MAQEPSPAIAALRERLVAPSPLAADEVTTLIQMASRAIEGRRLRVSDGVTSNAVDDRGREVLFVVLTGALPIEDVGLRSADGRRQRGLRAPATPPRSEVGAKQTLWIDVATLLPRRFEFAYEVQGLGDIAYDLVFDEQGEER